MGGRFEGSKVKMQVFDGHSRKKRAKLTHRNVFRAKKGGKDIYDKGMGGRNTLQETVYILQNSTIRDLFQSNAIATKTSHKDHKEGEEHKGKKKKGGIVLCDLCVKSYAPLANSAKLSMWEVWGKKSYQLSSVNL